MIALVTVIHYSERHPLIRKNLSKFFQAVDEFFTKIVNKNADHLDGSHSIKRIHHITANM